MIHATEIKSKMKTQLVIQEDRNECKYEFIISLSSPDEEIINKFKKALQYIRQYDYHTNHIKNT